MSHRPIVAALPDALDEVRPLLARAARARSGYVNAQGGDVGATGNARSLVHHVASYVAAADLAATVPVAGPLLDVGSGVGALSVWLATRLGRDLTLVDADPDVRAVAARAFPEAAVLDDLGGFPPAGAAVVTAMEVVEHVARHDQLGFVRALWTRLAPGGILICSTPDETRYAGRWSGYAPHIGSVDAAGLHHLLNAATGEPAAVWRLDGPAFALGPVRRFLEPLGNRLWARLDDRLPAAARTAAGAAGAAVTGAAVRLRGDEERVIPPQLLAVTVRPASDGTGTGLLGAVHRAGAPG
jgi:SAM-dependent methyltransferase